MADANMELAISNAEAFHKRMKAEQDLRGDIAVIMAKLNRSNLSAAEGERHANSLVEAYILLKPLE